VLQLGAGFIGCIIMEALAKRGVELTVVEMGDRMVPRMMTPKAGGMIKRWVEEKGIRVVTSAGVERIERSEAGDAPLTVSLSTGDKLPCDLVIVAAGVAPNVAFLDATPVHVAKGVLVDARMETSVPGIFAAGDVAEAPDLFTGAHLVSAIQPNAADQARVAAINMAGGNARMPGVLAINVLDTLGLISTSFGQWWGEPDGQGVEQVDEAAYRYLSLQFKDDVLIGHLHRHDPACGRAARADPGQAQARPLEGCAARSAPAFLRGLSGGNPARFHGPSSSGGRLRMRVVFKLFASLSDLPAGRAARQPGGARCGARHHGGRSDHPLPGAREERPPGAGQWPLHRTGRPAHVLKEGDELAIWPPIAGG
jgi:hypothetical protein